MFFKAVILIPENYNRLNTVSETHQNDQVNGIFLFANARSTVKLHKLSKELMVMWKKHIYTSAYKLFQYGKSMIMIETMISVADHRTILKLFGKN